MKFIIPFYDDERLTYTAEYLKNNGYIETDLKEQADFAVFAPGVKKEKINDFTDMPVFYGTGDFDRENRSFFDYNKREAFKLKNAVLTAEGALALFKQSSDKAILNSKILISGYGKIAKALYRYLKAFSCEVTVCCRSDADKAEAEINGAQVIDFNSASDKKYDAVFNTVAAIVFTKREIDLFDKDTIYFELASFPGGIDRHYAKARSIQYIDGSKLPKRFSKKTAGYLIGETIDDIIKEGAI